jgi:hypothetical protein
MSLIFPKKEILYAPMLGTLGGGSVRGFGRGKGRGGPFIWYGLVAGGGGGGDGNPAGGGGGAGGMAIGYGLFPMGERFRVQIGGGGNHPAGQDASGTNGRETNFFDDATSGSTGFYVRAYGGGHGASYGAAAGSGNNVGSAGGGSGPSNNNAGGNKTGVSGDVQVNNLVTGHTVDFYGNDGGDYLSQGSHMSGGGGGGAGGAGTNSATNNDSASTCGLAKIPQDDQGATLWNPSSSPLNWGRGGGGAITGGGNFGSKSLGYSWCGHGGAGSWDSPVRNECTGNAGGAIIRMPSTINVSIIGGTSGSPSYIQNSDADYNYLLIYTQQYDGNNQSNHLFDFTFYEV